MASDNTSNRGKDTNPDPITGAKGSHPIGTGVGAAAGGAAAGMAGAALAGAASGAAMTGPAAPIGAAIGAVIGAVAGGYAGKGVAEQIDPTAEDAYWRENYKTRPYVQEDSSYDQYAPAYRYGVEASQKHQGRPFEDVETDLRSNWETTHGRSGMGWDGAKDAVRDAWSRVSSGATQTRTLDEGQASIPVVEEELRVGKREVERGGMRVETRVEERPVQEQVNLREEHVRVERRPVDRPATAADINQAAASIEVRERGEEAVVQKTARVVEEVVVGKEATERTETISDTVRRTDVEVQETDATTEQQRMLNPDQGSTGHPGTFRGA